MGSINAFGLGKSFPGVVALEDVNFEVHSGTIHALVGANGAGKSTLVKILSGYYPDYQGQIKIDGSPVTITRPADALARGIQVVHQEVDTTLIPYLSVAENLLIERLASGRTGTFIRTGQLHKEARQMAERLGLEIDVRKRVEDLSLHQKQLLVIARALSRHLAYLILDEPTSSLGLQEIDRLFELLSILKERDVGIIYISHRLAEVREIADEVSVLRNGRKVAHFTGNLNLTQIVEAMLGMPAEETFPPRNEHNRGEVVLEVRNLGQRGRVHDVSFQLHRGEILGITGLTGAGKTELLHLLFGAENPDSGEILIKGQRVRFSRPGTAVKHGIFLIPEERRRQGLWVENSVRENITIPFLKSFSAAGWVLRQRENRHARHIIRQVGLVPSEPEMQVKNLSGGNQQKVVIGRWMGREPRVMIFDEATQGIDVGAKQEVYNQARRLAEKAGVIFASSEIDEVLGLADRVLVMRDGCVVAEFAAAEADRQVVLEYATGARV
jgi:simple sugar transport system ATP-binding protein